MKIEILETIALALASDNKEGCTDALKDFRAKRIYNYE